jgi:hypothetical protein
MRSFIFSQKMNPEAGGLPLAQCVPLAHVHSRYLRTRVVQRLNNDLTALYISKPYWVPLTSRFSRGIHLKSNEGVLSAIKAELDDAHGNGAACNFFLLLLVYLCLIAEFLQAASALRLEL